MKKKVSTIVITLTFLVQAYSQPTLSFTFDDGVTGDMPGYTFEEWNSKLLDHLDDAGVKAIFFVTGYNKSDEKGQYLLKSWNDRGHSIGNHTFSHPNFGSKTVTFEKFEREFLMTDSIIRAFDNYVRLFRFPYLKEGDAKEKIARFRSVMREHDYKNGHATIDASDWYVDSRLRIRLKENHDADLVPYRKFYLEHLYNRALYYEELAFALTGRHIKHTLLLHHNLTSALFLGDLVKYFRGKGWNIVDATEAYADPIFRASPSNVPAGESLIWALAKESGKYEAILRYPAEDSMYEKDRMDALGL